MVWQSYTVGFNTEEEKQSILDVVRKHNTSKDWEIFGINVVKVKTQYKRGPLGHYNYLMMFGHSGRRQGTYTFMNENWVRVVPYEKTHTDRCDKKTAVQLVLEYEDEV